MTYAQFVSNFWLTVQLNSSDLITAGRITAAQVESFLMDGIYEMLRQAGPVSWLRTSADIACTAGTGEIWLTDNVNVNGLVDQSDKPPIWRWSADKPTLDGVEIPFLTYGQLTQMQAGGVSIPAGSFLYDMGMVADTGTIGERSGWKICIYPALTEAATLRIYYQRKPLALSAMSSTSPFYSAVSGHSGRTYQTTEYPDLPDEHCWGPVYWAAMKFAALGIESKTQLPVDSWGALFAAHAKNFRRDQSIYMQRNQPQRTDYYLDPIWTDF